MSLEKYEILTTTQIKSEKRLQLCNLKLELLQDIMNINDELTFALEHSLNTDFIKGKYFQINSTLNLINFKLEKLG